MIFKMLKACTRCCSPTLHAVDGPCQEASLPVRLLCPCKVHLCQEALSFHAPSLLACFCLPMPDEDALDPRLATATGVISHTFR